MPCASTSIKHGENTHIKYFYLSVFSTEKKQINDVWLFSTANYLQAYFRIMTTLQVEKKKACIAPASVYIFIHELLDSKILCSIKYTRRHSCPGQTNWNVRLCWRSEEGVFSNTPKTVVFSINTVLNNDYNFAQAPSNSQTAQTNRAGWIKTLTGSKFELSFCY